MQVRKTETFKKWLKKLRDQTGKSLILARIDRLEEGNPGDWEPVGEGVFEMRIHYGPGYRLYCKETVFPDAGTGLIILLCGGDKSTRQADITKAKQIALNPLKEEENDGNSE
ncbi:addiction module antitoxin RelB [Spirochaetia bacterium]|nr:addiction module antitoxin RelB [Spirochaetia bacterium]